MSSEFQENCFGRKSLEFESCEATMPMPTDLGMACVRCLVPAVMQLRNEKQEIIKEKEALIKQADYDTLTNIFGRHAFERMIEEQIAVGEPFALLFADLINFGEANKREGHTGGDLMLVSTAQFLTEQVRQDDGVVYRWGGDEFCVILKPSFDDDGRRKSEASIDDAARVVANRLMSSYQNSFTVKAYNDFHQGNQPLGIAIDYSIWEPGMDSLELVTRADPKHNPYS